MRLQDFYTLSATLSDAPIGTIAPRELAGSRTRGSEASARLVHRRRLIAAAAELFSRQGYRNTGLREIAAEAGCATSTIRREFGGKVSLLEEVIRACGVCEGVQPRASSDGQTYHRKSVGSWCGKSIVCEGRENRYRPCCPWTMFDPIILQVAEKLSLGGSTQILHNRLRKHGIGDAELEFLVSVIQAVGLALGWTGFEESNRVMFKVKQVAKMLASGLKQE